MPKNLTDVDAFTSPIVVPVDADAADAASVEVGFQGLADRTRTLANRLGGASGSAEWEYPTPRARIRVIEAWAGFAADNNTGIGWRSFATGDGVVLEALANGVDWLFSLSWLPEGAEVTRLRAWVDPAVARASAGDRMQLEVIEHEITDPTGGGSGAGASLDFTKLHTGTTDNGTSDLQRMDTGVLGSPIPVSKSWLVSGTVFGGRFVRVRSGATSTVSDRLYALEIYYTDPGPMNL